MDVQNGDERNLIGFNIQYLIVEGMVTIFSSDKIGQERLTARENDAKSFTSSSGSSNDDFEEKKDKKVKKGEVMLEVKLFGQYKEGNDLSQSFESNGDDVLNKIVLKKGNTFSKAELSLIDFQNYKIEATSEVKVIMISEFEFEKVLSYKYEFYQKNIVYWILANQLLFQNYKHDQLFKIVCVAEFLDISSRVTILDFNEEELYFHIPIKGAITIYYDKESFKECEKATTDRSNNENAVKGNFIKNEIEKIEDTKNVPNIQDHNLGLSTLSNNRTGSGLHESILEKKPKVHPIPPPGTKKRAFQSAVAKYFVKVAPKTINYGEIFDIDH